MSLDIAMVSEQPFTTSHAYIVTKPANTASSLHLEVISRGFALMAG